MHRQQNPPNVLIIELGELVGLGRNSNEGEVTVGIQRYRDCTEFLWFAGDLSDWMGDLDTDISVPFSSSFLCVSLVTTAIHDNVIPFEHTLLLYYQALTTPYTFGHMLPVDTLLTLDPIGALCVLSASWH